MPDKNSPLVSVIMPVFNEQEYLSKSIESILNQTFRDFEFIIVDDASTDASSEILKRYASEDRRSVLIRNPVNQGLALSLNNALSVAKGEFIARMDADDIAVKDRLEIQLAFLNKNPEISLVGSSMYMIDFKGNIITQYDTIANPQIFKKRIYYKNSSPHPTWMFRKKILKDIKRYRDIPTSQDYDFLMRLHYLGYEVSNIDIPLVYYRVHDKKISVDRHITQIKLSRYLRRLYRKGLILNDYYFKKEQISKIITTFRTVQKIHDLSLRFFEKGKFSVNNNSYISGIIFLCISALLSPYITYSIYCDIRARLLQRKTK